MRDWLMILTPIVVVLWVLMYPEQSQAIADWATDLVAGVVGR
jgi:hypothetical protein